MLEQIKKELADLDYKTKTDKLPLPTSFWKQEEFAYKEFFKSGFNACMNLELPIKFAEWYSTEGLDNIVGLNGKEKEIEYKQFRNKGATKELFNYWINNVYGK